MQSRDRAGERNRLAQSRGAAVKAHRKRNRERIASADLAATDLIMDPPVDSQDLAIADFLVKNLPGLDIKRSLRLCESVGLAGSTDAGDVSRPLAMRLAAECEVHVARHREYVARASKHRPPDA